MALWLAIVCAIESHSYGNEKKPHGDEGEMKRQQQTQSKIDMAHLDERARAREKAATQK